MPWGPNQLLACAYLNNHVRLLKCYHVKCLMPALFLSPIIVYLIPNFLTLFFVSGIQWASRPGFIFLRRSTVFEFPYPEFNLSIRWCRRPITSANSLCICLPVLPFKYKYRIRAQYWTLEEKYAFASLAMFDIQYLIKKWLNMPAILYPCIKHVLKQGMKIVTASVNQNWDRLVTYGLALVHKYKNIFMWNPDLIYSLCFLLLLNKNSGPCIQSKLPFNRPLVFDM